MSSGHIPSLDSDDHLTLKKFKFLHFKESNSQAQSTVQTPQTMQPTVNTQSTTPSQSITHSTIPTPLPEVVDIEDSDEEQGLQANICNEISSPPTQTTATPTLSKAGPSKQPNTEQPIKLSADVQPEQTIAGPTGSD